MRNMPRTCPPTRGRNRFRRRRSGRLGPAGGLLLGRRLGDERGREALLDRLARHDALLDVAAGGQLELHLEQDLLEDRAQAARAGLALERLLGDRGERVVREDELDPVEGEEALELLDERVARLGEDRDEVLARELVDGGHDGQATDELGDQAVLDQVLGQAVLEYLARVAFLAGLDRRGEANAVVPDASLDHLVEMRERPTANEQDVGRVDREELLMRVLAPSLWGHRGMGALE